MHYKLGDKVELKSNSLMYSISHINQQHLIGIPIESSSIDFINIFYRDVAEVWRDVAGYEKLYEVSTLGRVRSYKYKKILKENESNTYVKVDLNKDGMRKAVKIHRLVAETFILNPYKKEQVNHKNCNKFDNRVENLEWVTQSENQIHAIDSGLRKCNAIKHKHEIIKDYQSGEMSFRELIKKYRTSKPPVVRILKGAGLSVRE